MAAVEFRDQIALVTGAGRGLGRAYALLLAKLGATVVVHDAGVNADGTGTDPGVADAVVEEVRAEGRAAVAAYEDLSARPACEAVVAAALSRFGRVDALVHSAGVALRARLADVDDEGWRRSLAINAEAAFWLARAVIPAMRAQEYGRIVLTVSGHGLAPGDEEDLVAYGVGKAAQFGLMNALAGSNERAGIRINAISPVAATRMYTREVPAHELTPEQVAPGVAFLASRACDVSGVVLRAANGRFSVGRYAGSEGVDFGRNPVSADQIAQRWDEIAAARR